MRAMPEFRPCSPLPSRASRPVTLLLSGTLLAAACQEVPTEPPAPPAAAAVASAAPGWSYFELLPPGAIGSEPSDMNDRGQVVGIYYGPGSPYYGQGFLWQNGRYTDLGTFIPVAINNRGDMVGSAAGNPALMRHGVVTPLPGHPADINDLGHVVGQFLTTAAPGLGRMHGYTWRDGVTTDLGALRTTPDWWDVNWSDARRINNRGQIVGTSGQFSFFYWLYPPQAYLWEDGVMRSLGTMTDQGFGIGYGTAINDRGQVIGTAEALNEWGLIEPPFLWQAGSMTQIGDWPEGLIGVYDINEQGIVAGRCQNAARRQYSCLWRDGALTDLGGPDFSSPRRVSQSGREVLGHAPNLRAAILWQRK